MAQQDIVHPDALELASLLRPAWAEISESIPGWHPRMEEPADLPADPSDPADPPAGPSDPPADPPADPADPPADPADPIDWKAMARKHEREKKAAIRERDAHAAKLAEIEKSNLSDQEKAIATAREEARAEAKAESDKERRGDRIEAAVKDVAAIKGVTVGDGDKAKTVKFADPDDVQMWLERQIDKGEIDGDELYTDGKVDADILIEALTGLAVSKPGWLVGAPANGNGAGAPAGSADAGKGGSRGGGTSVKSELDAIRQHKS